MGEEGIKEERLKVRALVGERVVVLGGELSLCPVLDPNQLQLQLLPVTPAPGSSCDEFIPEPQGS